MHVKRFTGAIGRRAKNDRLEAELIAHDAEAINPILTAIKNQITKIELKIQKLIEECIEYQSKNIILQSMPGIGKIAAASIISNVPELGYITNKQAASLIGVAPMIKESGIV